jgi:hypothetical protein
MRLARTLVASIAFTLAAASLGVAATATAGGQDDHGGHHDYHRADYTFAVIGDVPYGADQLAAFPKWIQQINDDPAVQSVVHLGDVKNGSSVCSDEYFQMIRGDFNLFEDPLVYTPGDNEWTDCHRANNGAYNPLERLAKVREIFYNHPGSTLGQDSFKVESQARRGFPENVMYSRAGLTFVTANITGSNNGLQPWAGLGNTEPTPEQRTAVAERTRADIDALRSAFKTAKHEHDRGVVVMQQADMFDPTYAPTWNDIGAFQSWVQALIDEASRFDGPVYLFDGDSHVYNTDKPLAAGSSWLTTYDVRGSANNLTRVTVDGSSNNNDYLRVTVGGEREPLLSWERVPYAS